MAMHCLYVCPNCKKQLAKPSSTSFSKRCPNCGAVMGVYFEREIERDTRGVLESLTKGW
jgi:phage FluMu protein Com